MRKALVLSVFAFTLSLAVFALSDRAYGVQKPYFGFNIGYAYQELELDGHPLITRGTGDIVTNIKEDGFFISPKAGIFLVENSVGGLALEFEPRWTATAYRIQTRPGELPTETVTATVEEHSTACCPWDTALSCLQTVHGQSHSSSRVRYAEPDGALHHVLLPLVAIAKAEGEKSGASIGFGSGINFYDIADEIYQHTSIPLVFKVQFWALTSDNVSVGLDGQLTLSVWNSENSVDNLVSASAGLKVGFN